MPSNKDLTADIKELDADAVTDGLNNADLSALLKKLREAKDLEGDKPEEPVAVAVAVGHTVAEGKAITSARGVLEGGDELSADDLGGGADALAALVKSGHVVAPK